MDLNSDIEDFEIVELDEVVRQMVTDDPTILSKVTAWLNPTDYQGLTSEYQRHLSSQATGTGEWIRETSQFKQWHTSPAHGSIWVKAVPGAGKSVIAASMVRSLATKESVPILFFFFRQIIETNRTARSLVCDWLAQLGSYSDRLQYTLWQLIDVAKKQLDDVSTRELWQILRTTLSEFNKVYCIVDALDEMDLDNGFLTQINSLGSFKPAHIKILLTSRPKQYLQQFLRDSSLIHVNLEEELVKQDILMFVVQRLRAMTTLNDKTRDHLISTICKRSEGLFLYARLMLDQVADTLNTGLLSDDDVREMVEQLPTGLEDMYNRVLRDARKAAGVTQEIQGLILELVIFAPRPLRLVEIAGALESDSSLSGSLQDSKQVVRSACGPLLEIVENEIVQILHHSFTEFLMDTKRTAIETAGRLQFPILNSDMANRRIALLCFTSLQEKIFHDYPEGSQPRSSNYRGENLKPVFLKYPFTRYAIESWSYHVRALPKIDEDLFQIMQLFCNPSSRSFREWLGFHALQDTPQVSETQITPLHVAAGFGLVDYAQRLISDGANVDAQDKRERTSMHWCSLNGYHETAKILVESRADPNMSQFDGLTPLHISARRNHAKLVKVLLEAGVSPKTPKTKKNPENFNENLLLPIGATALSCASDKETIIEMLPYTDIEDMKGILLRAAQADNSQVLALMLDIFEPDVNQELYGTNLLACTVPNVNQELYATNLLACAVSNVSKHSVKLLLERGANSAMTIKAWGIYHKQWHHQMTDGRTAIHLLASQPQRKWSDAEPILKMLIEAGADINAKDEEGCTPFQLLLHDDPGNYGRTFPTRKNEEWMEMFLANGADPNVTDNSGEGPIHLYGFTSSDSKSTELLLKHGADPNLVRISDGATPLHCAVRCTRTAGHFQILLEHGADPNARDLEGRTPLHLLCSQSHPYAYEEIESLIKHSADVNVRNNNGETCLYHLTSHGHADKLLKLIFGAGFNSETYDIRGFTLLHHICEKDYDFDEVLVELYFQQSKVPNILARSRPDGKSVLHLVCRSVYPRRSFKKLLKYGADVFALDNDGNTLLHEMAARFTGYHEDVKLVEDLLQLGIDPTAVNNAKQTVLHVMPLCKSVSSSSETMTSVIHRLAPHVQVDARDSEGYTALHYAAASWEYLTYDLLSIGANPNARSNAMQTPLHCAARARNSGNLELLLAFTKNSGVELELEVEDQEGNTPLHYACRSGRQESVSILLAAGGKMGERSSSYFKACAEAQNEDKFWADQIEIQSSEKSKAFKLREYKPFRPVFPTDECTSYQAKSDQRLCKIRTDDITLMLLNTLGSLAKEVEVLKTAAAYAIDYKDTAMLQVLQDKAVDLEKSKECPWTRAQIQEFKEATRVSASLQAGIGLDVLHPDLYASNVSVTDLRTARKLGYDSTSSTNVHGVPIANVAEKGLIESMRILLPDAKIIGSKEHIEILNDDPELRFPIRDQLAKPLLHVACSRSLWNFDMVKLLVEDGALDVNIHHLKTPPGIYEQSSKVVPGPTALHILAKANHYWQIEAAKYLIDQGAKVDAVDECGETPLCKATRLFDQGFYCLEMCELLLNAGANVNFQTPSGDTPLTLAGARHKIIKTLLKHGVSLTVGHKLPLIAAIESIDVDAVRLCLEHGADPNLEYFGERINFNVPVGWRPSADTEFFPLLIVLLDLGRETDGHVQKALQLGRLMLDYGARLDIPLVKANTLMLHFLIQHVTPPILDFLLEQDFDPNLRDQTGKTVFLAACLSSRSLMQSTLSLDSRGESSYTPAYLKLMNSPKHGSKIDFLATDNDGRHVLNYSLFEWNERKETLLHIAGVESLIHKIPNDRMSLLHQSFLGRHFRTALDLVQNYGVDVLESGPEGNTTMHLCLKSFLPYISITALRKQFEETKGQRPEIEIDEATTNSAAATQLIKDFYLARGGDPNAQNTKGNTPLMEHLSYCNPRSRLARSVEREDIVANLVLFKNWGITFTQVINNEGQGPLHIIANRPVNHETKEYTTMLFKALWEAGCEPLMEDKNGLTALDIAVVTGNDGILQLLERDAENNKESRVENSG